MSIHTEQLVSRRKRRIVRVWVEDRVDPQERGLGQTQHTDQSHQAADHDEVPADGRG